MPAQGNHVIAAAAQSPEQRHLLPRGKGTPGKDSFLNLCSFSWSMCGGAPGDALRLQQPDQACVLPAQLIHLRVHGVSHRASARVGLPVDSIALPLAHRHNQHQHLPIPHLVDAAKSG